MEDGSWLKPEERKRYDIIKKEIADLLKKHSYLSEKVSKKTITEKENGQRLLTLKKHKELDLEIKLLRAKKLQGLVDKI